MKYSEIDILEFLDGQFNDEQTADFLAELRRDPELADLTKAMQASEVPIHQAYQQIGTPPVPDALRENLEVLVQESSVPVVQNSKQSSSGKWISMGLAASLVCGLGMGAILMQQFQLRTNNSVEVAQQQSANAEQTHLRLVQRIADYQSLYIENTVSNASTTRLQEAKALLEKIESNKGLNIGIPDFAAFGYEFARAQELGFEGDTLVQLVYRKAGSPPLAFCYMRTMGAPSRALQLSQYHHLQGASWVSNSQHYVLLADEPNTTLKQMHAVATALF